MIILLPLGFTAFKDFASRSSALEYWYWKPFWFDLSVGMICAVAWVLIIVAIAPTRRITAAGLSLLPGAWLAWFIIGDSTFMVHLEGLNFFRTRSPTYLTWWAGLAALVVIWRIARRRGGTTAASHDVGKGMRKAILAVAIFQFLVIVLPAMFILWRFVTYTRINDLITAGPEEKAIRCVEEAHRNLLYNLDWTLPQTLGKIPLGYKIYATLVGCTSCAGHWRTPLLVAAGHGRVNVLKKILDLRGSVDYYGDSGTSALSAGLKHPAVLKLLLCRGADPKVKSKAFGESIIHLAVLQKVDEDTMLSLISSGVDINATDSRGWTARDVATVWNTNAIPFLVSHGAICGSNHSVALPVNNAGKTKQ